MRAIRVHETGGPEALRAEELPRPEPGPGEALVAVAAAGINFIDIYQRSGLYALPLPFTAGSEAAGTVEAVGEGVSGLAVGERVAYCGVLGAYAEYAAVPADRLVRIPDGVTPLEAAALMLQGMTAHYLAVDTFPLAAGDTALVHAGAGGVGLLLTQLAKRRGAAVVSTVSTGDKAELSERAGADHVILYRERDFAAETERLLGPRSIDVVYDSVGRDTLRGSMSVLRPRGMLVSYGQSSGPPEPVETRELQDAGSIFLTRPSLAHYIARREELERRAADLLRWVADGELALRIDRQLPLEEAAEAQRLLASRATAGKLLLVTAR
ncbi:MAG: quinone oxidoreductase [Chloroflexi bacterium]|nr:quinone oxidoreductase [Chloroflexota bacterium]